MRQNYLTFSSRAGPRRFASGPIKSLVWSDAVCVDLKRTNASAAFFLSTEFRETGFLVYRMYKAAYDIWRECLSPKVGEFLPDTRQIGLGVV